MLQVNKTNFLLYLLSSIQLWQVPEFPFANFLHLMKLQPKYLSNICK